MEPLKSHLNNIEYSKAIIFGTGGASKAVKIGLESEGFEELFFVSRRPNQKNIKSKHSEIRVLDYNQWQSFAEEADLFVNTTPVGMYPKPDKTFLRKGEAKLFEGKVCYDLIYNPLETTFLKQAKTHGAVTVNGLDMLIYQGSKSFELWTGNTFPVDEIRSKLINQLKAD